jgi:hemerythrin-like domain-containing protein
MNEAAQPFDNKRCEMADGARPPAGKLQVSLKDVQAFQQAVEDHRFLSEYLANVHTSAELFREQQPGKRVEAMKAFLAEHVIGHFAFEEKHVFPQLVASESAVATRQAVLELVGEHKAMKVDVSRLRRKMRSVRASGTAQALARLEDSFRDFLAVLQAHAVKEDNILLAVKQSRRRAVPFR